MTLRQRTFAGVRWTSVSSLGRALLQVIQVTILARLLSPADFGSVAIAVALIAMLQVFADVGVSSALVHFRDVTREEADSLYCLNVGVSLILTLGLIIASWPVAVWYHQEDLRPLLSLAAASLFAASIGQQLRILAQKELRFNDLARVELGGATVGAVVAIGMALLHAGAFALISGSVATATATSVLAWIYLAGEWRPHFRMRWQDVRRFVQFGALNVGNNIINTFNSQLDVLLAGRFLGTRLIGTYNVPKDLSLRIAGFINPIVTEVSFPVMATAQTDVALLRRLYLQVMRMTMSVTFPAYAALAVFAPEVVRIVLGSAWVDSGPILRILACWGLLRAIGNPVGTLVMARGRLGINMIWNIAQLIVLPPAVFFGSRFGLQGVAVAMLTFVAVLYFPNWYFLIKPLCGATFVEYTNAIAVPLFLSTVAGAIAYAVVLPISDPLGRLVVGTAVGMTAYLAVSYRWNKAWSLAMVELLANR